MAWNMMMHSLRMLMGNLGSAIKLTLIPVLATFAVMIVIFLVVGQNGPSGELSVILVGFLAVFAYVILSAWMAVGWHRFILLEEFPSGYIPPWRGDEIKIYFWRVLMLALLLAAIAAAIIVLVFLISSVVLGSLMLTLLAIIAIPVLTWLTFRVSMMLPAAALGESMSISESFRATEAHSGTIFVFALIYLGVTVVLQICFGVLLFVPVLGVLFQLVGSWFSILLGLSVLTTIYGVAIQGRTLTA